VSDWKAVDWEVWQVAERGLPVDLPQACWLAVDYCLDLLPAADFERQVVGEPDSQDSLCWVMDLR
jgi:hypothetical protein